MKTRCQAAETGVSTDISVTVSLVTSLKRADGQSEEKCGEKSAVTGSADCFLGVVRILLLQTT